MAKLAADIPSQEDILQGLRNFDQIRKSTTSVTGLELVRQDLEDDLKLAANLKTPVRKRLKRKKGNGKAHAYYKLISNPGAVVTQAKFLGSDPTNMAFAKGGLPNAVDPQYQYISRPYANLGDLVIVPWQDIAQDQSFIDIKAQQRNVKMRNVALAEEYFIINGSAASTGGLAFDGLLTQITNDGFNILDVSGGGGGALDYGTIRTLGFQILLAGGETRAIIMSYTMKALFTRMFGQLYAIRQMNNTSDGKWQGGFEVDSWNFGWGQVDLIADQYMLPDPVTGLERLIFMDDQSSDEANSGNSIEMVDVDAMNYVDLMAITTAERGIVYETSMLQVGITQFQGLYRGVNPNLVPIVSD